MPQLRALPTRSPASEVFRQIALLESGKAVPQETRGFDEDKAETYTLRSKEDAPDYRYMPDPNLPPLLIEAVRLSLPEIGFTDQIPANRAMLLLFARACQSFRMRRERGCTTRVCLSATPMYS